MRTLFSFYVGRAQVSLELKWEDLWVGAFWRRELVDVPSENHFWLSGLRYRYEVWVCLLPCLPIHVRTNPTCL